MPAKRWPPPGFPLVQGDHALTADWTIHLPEQFARRVEQGSLVLWRPGLTVWLEVWGNDRQQSQSERLNWLRAGASADRTGERESHDGGVTRWSYRLREGNEDGPVESVYGVVIGENGHVTLAVYFDDAADEVKARELVEHVSVREQ